MIHTTSAKTGRLWLRLAICIALVLPLLAHAGKDRLDTPAYRAPKVAGAMLLGVTRANHRLVAVGEHGVIVYSDTNGKSWRQAEVPVSVTLTAVHFPTPKMGWAVGHDGVILRSDDAGGRWTKQFDGNKANALVLAAAERREKDARAAYAGSLPGRPAAAWQAAERALEDAQAGAKFGPSRPLFGVWFRDESEGIVVGSFGQIFHTRDGGQTWAIWGDRIENPDNLHYNAISVTGRGALLITGEAGKLYRSDDGGVSWVTLDTGYAGQLYGVVGVQGEADAETLIAFGFGGHVFRSADKGARWQQVAIEENKPLVAGSVLPDGRIALLTYDGKILCSENQGQSFKSESSGAGMSVAAMAQIDNSAFIVAGANSTRIVSINNTAKTR